MKEVRKANWFFLGLVILYIGGSFGIAYLNRKITIPYNLLVMSSQIIIALATAGYCILTKTNPIKTVMHSRLDIIDILLVILLMVLFMPVVYLINYFSMLFTENEIAKTMNGMINNPFLLNLFYIAVCPAFLEELVCRGIMHHSYRGKSIRMAALLSAFLFGLLHMNINQMSYAIAAGLIFSLAIEATGSIYASMIMHFIMNGFSVAVMWVVKMMMKTGIYGEDISAGMDAAADMKPVIGGFMGIVLFILALLVVSALLVAIFGVLILLATRKNRLAEFKAVFKPVRQKEASGPMGEALGAVGETEVTGTKVREMLLTYAPLVIAVIICLYFMLAP